MSSRAISSLLVAASVAACMKPLPPQPTPTVATPRYYQYPQGRRSVCTGTATAHTSSTAIGTGWGGAVFARGSATTTVGVGETCGEIPPDRCHHDHKMYEEDVATGYCADLHARIQAHNTAEEERVRDLNEASAQYNAKLTADWQAEYDEVQDHNRTMRTLTIVGAVVGVIAGIAILAAASPDSASDSSASGR